MKKEKREKHFVGKATYPGGVKALQAFLKANKKYPEEALKKKIEGTVHIRYTIDYQGKVVKTHVIAGIGHGCDKEAERIVKLLKFKVPKSHKLKVQFHKTIHIHFRLPQEEKSKSGQITYDIVESERGENKSPRSYNYSIRLN